MSESSTRPTIAYATPPEFRRDVLIVRPSRAFGIVLIATGGLLLAFCGLLVLAHAARPRMDFLLVFMIGALTVATGVHILANRRPKLIVSDTVFLSTIGNRIELRWSDIAEVRAANQDETAYLILRLVDPTAQPQPPMLWNRPDFDRPSEAANDDILLPISGLDASPDHILRQIRIRIDAVRGQTV